jgi:hypothetical protein
MNLIKKLTTLEAIPAVLGCAATLVIGAAAMYGCTKLAETAQVPIRFGWHGEPATFVSSKYALLAYPLFASFDACAIVSNLTLKESGQEPKEDGEAKDVGSAELATKIVSVALSFAMIAYSARRSFAVAQNPSSDGLDSLVIGLFFGFQSALLLPIAVNTLTGTAVRTMAAINDRQSENDENDQD